MGENELGRDPSNNEQEGRVPKNEPRPEETDEYELTAKDAGWRTPTLLISPAKLVYFDPPRPRKRRADELESDEE